MIARISSLSVAIDIWRLAQEKALLRISVVVRFRNEAAHLGAVLEAVRAQYVQAQVELTGVDNLSSDTSRKIAERYCDRVIPLAAYAPGAALNRAIEAVPCEYAAFLSAHTIPSNAGWLAALLREAKKPDTLGVYGAQIYPYYSRFLDKRDLSIFSTPKRRIETRDSDLWNANSMISRSAWETLPFDEKTFELEDHYWTKCGLNGANCVRFVPDAVVYHYSHDTRNDRHLPAHLLGEPETQLESALSTLDDAQAAWPDIMMAALAVKTLRSNARAGAARPALIRLLGEHWDFDVRWRVADVLGAMPSAPAIEALVTGLNDPSYYASNECAWALARCGGDGARRLSARLGTILPRQMPLAVVALGRSGEQEALAHAIALAEAGIAATTGELQRNYIFAAGELGGLHGAGALLALLPSLAHDADEETRAAIAWALGELMQTPDPSDAVVREVADATAALAGDSSAIVRAETAIAAGKIALTGRRTFEPTVSTLIRDTSGRVRYGALQVAAALIAKGRPITSGDPDDEDFGAAFECRALKAAVANEANA